MDSQKQSKDDGEKTQATPTTTDDESMTTSTASDSFESWTLVMDKQKEETKNENNTEDKENHIEELKNDNDKKLEISKEKLHENYDEEDNDDEPPPDYNAATGTISATNDEFSDEVSIISESDSCELLTTQNLPSKDKDFLHKLNLKFTTGVGLDLPTLLQEQHLVEQRSQRQQKRESPPTFKIALVDQNLRQRKRRSPSNEQNQKSLRTTGTTAATRTTTTTIPYEGDTQRKLPFCCLAAQFIKRGIFILLGLMAIVAFTKLFVSFGNPLQQKILDMEKENIALQYQINNFQREIKKLNEGVTALKNQLQKELNENVKKFPPEEESAPDPKWRSKEDEAKAEKIINDLFEKIRNDEKIRIETEENEFPTDTNNNNNSNNNKEQQENFNKEENHFNDNNKKQKENFNKKLFFKEKRNSKEFKDHSGEQQEYKQKRKGKLNGNYKNDNSKERYNKDNDDDDDSEERFYKHKKNRKRDSNEKFNKRDESNEKINKRDNSNERINKKRNNSKERQFNADNFKEHNLKNDENNNENINFKTRQQPKRRDNSKERFNDSKVRKPRKTFNSDENQSGEWMEKLMLQREEARRTQEQILEAEKNWFLNRNDGREQWRVNDENLS